MCLMPDRKKVSAGDGIILKLTKKWNKQKSNLHIVPARNWI